MKITGPMKTKITNDLLFEFPGYKKENLASIAKRVGPLLISIGYEVRYSTDIKIGCSLFNLSNGLERMCANLDTIPKSRRDNITFEQHEKGLYKEAAAELKELFPIPLEGPVTLKQVFEGYKKYTSNPYAIRSERHYQDPALIAAWAGKLDKAQEYLDWGYDAYMAANIFKPDPKQWYKDMQQRITDPDALRKIVAEQIEHHKLGKIPYQELIVD